MWKTKIFPEITVKIPSTANGGVIHRKAQPEKNEKNSPQNPFHIWKKPVEMVEKSMVILTADFPGDEYNL